MTDNRDAGHRGPAGASTEWPVEHLDFPLYFSPWFVDFATTVSGSQPVHEFSWTDTDRALAMMPVAAKESEELGLVVNSMPWYGSLGGVLLARGAPDNSRGALLRDFKARIQQADVSFASINVTPDEMTHLSVYREALQPDVEFPRRTQVTLLPENGPSAAENLMSVFHPKARNAVRKGLASGLTIERCDDDETWIALANIHEENMRILGGRPKGKRSFDVLRSMAPQGSVVLSRATLDGRIIAVLLLIRAEGTLEYITPAVAASYRHTQALSALIWSEMLLGIESGARAWNWGGTGWNQESLFRFKSRLGGRVIDYATLICHSDEALQRLHAIGGRLPDALQDYFVFPFSNLPSSHERVSDE